MTKYIGIFSAICLILGSFFWAMPLWDKVKFIDQDVQKTIGLTGLALSVGTLLIIVFTKRKSKTIYLVNIINVLLGVSFFVFSLIESVESKDWMREKIKKDLEKKKDRSDTTPR